MRTTILLPALVALAGVLASSTAHAEAVPPPPRSPAVAVTLAAAPVAAGAALVTAAVATDNGGLMLLGVGTLVVGPSFGHFYAGERDQGWFTTGARTGGLVLMTAGALMQTEVCLSDTCSDRDDDDNGGNVLLVAGAGVFVAATVYDIVDAGFAARRTNQRLTVAPTMVSGAAGNAPGMAISGRF